eukprot:623706_1
MFLSLSENKRGSTATRRRSMQRRRRGGSLRGQRRRRGRLRPQHVMKEENNIQTTSSTTHHSNTLVRQKEKKQDCFTIDTDKLLFEIWSIINCWKDTTVTKQLASHSITSLKDLQDVSLYHLFELVSSIDWSAFNNNMKQTFLNKIEQLKRSTHVQTPVIHQHIPSSMPPAYNRRRHGKRGRCRGRGRGRGRRRGRGRCIGRAPPMQNIGFALGGAKDIHSFRDNITSANQMPQLNAITFEGIYYDYYFQTEDHTISNDDAEDEKTAITELPMFYPSYCYAKSCVPDALLMAHSKNVTEKWNHTDMIEGDHHRVTYDFHLRETIKDDTFEYYLTVGLNSNIKAADFARKKLNLVMVLDISGSMGSTFNGSSNALSKMKTANQCVLAMITNLKADDRFGLVLFDHTVQILMDLQPMKCHDINSFENILNITAQGGTDFELGYRAALDLFDQKLGNVKLTEYENRMIMVTDACPNAGSTDPQSLMSLVRNAATRKERGKRIYTTFVGVGLDFNCDLVSEISKVRGANYFAVHSPKEFMNKIHLEFDYIVSPMVFDLKLSLQREGNRDNSCIEAVYGSNDIDVASGEIMNINTLFPSPPNDEGETKGSIVLIKLNKSVRDQLNDIQIECCFEDKFGKKYKNMQSIAFNKDRMNEEYYANMAVRKGILLTRYVILMKQWIENSGSVRLQVSDKYKQIFGEFMRYFENEMNCIKDDQLKQEMQVLKILIN